MKNLRADLDNNNMIYVLVLLDHTKAFDTVDHFIFLKKLDKLFCFSETACRLLRLYHTSRSHIVSYNGTCSVSGTFFLENALKKTTEYLLKFLYLFKSLILPVNNGK